MTPGAAALVAAIPTAAVVLGAGRRISAVASLLIATIGAALAITAASVAGGGDDAVTLGMVLALEAALSLDAVVATLVLITYFSVPEIGAVRVVRWAVGTTIVLRLTAVPLGAAAVDRAEWLVYPLAALLAATTFALTRTGPADVEARTPGRNRALAIAGRITRVANRYDEDRLRTPTATGPAWTPLAVAVVCVVGAAVVLALDGFAAGRAITDDTMLVAAATVLACSMLGAFHRVAQRHLGGILHIKAGLSLLLLFAAIRLAATGADGVGIGPAAGAVVIALVVAVLAAAGLGPIPRRPQPTADHPARSEAR